MKVFSRLAAAAVLTVVMAQGAYAATLGLATEAPAATGEGFVSIDGGTLDMFGDITGGSAAALLGLPVFLLYDDIGGDFELDIALAAVTDVGFSGQTLEFLLSHELFDFPDGVLLTVTGSVFAGIDAAAGLDAFLFDAPSIADAEVTFALATLAPIPLPASWASLALAIGGFGLWSRRMKA